MKPPWDLMTLRAAAPAKPRARSHQLGRQTRMLSDHTALLASIATQRSQM